MGVIRVVIADDDSLARRALAAYVGSAGDMVIVGEAEDGQAAVEAVERLAPDIVLMDLHMPHMDGREATIAIGAIKPETRVLAITTFGTVDSVVPVLRAGASGYLLKDAAPQEIIEAIRLVHSGAGALSPDISGKLIRALRTTGAGSLPTLSETEKLSARETEVVENLASGKSNNEIAQALHLSEGTVKAHLSSVMLKWNARDRVQVLIQAARFGLITFH